MYKIGLRNIKTAIALTLTMAISLVLMIVDQEISATWYSPFFAGIAAAYSMQSKQSASFLQARIRSYGSIFGGLFGLAIMLVYETYIMAYIVNRFGFIAHMALIYSIVGLMVVLLVYLLVISKKTDYIFVAILTYLSVTIGARNNLPVTLFAMNRILSTIIGVMIALLVNSVHFRTHKNQDILFVTGLDGTLIDHGKQLTGYARFKLNHLISKGANITVSTTRTPASISKILTDIEFKLPLTIMNGSAMFDMDKEIYSHIIPISKKAQCGIKDLLYHQNKNGFVYTILDGVLSIYHSQFENEAEKQFFEDRKHDYFRSHIKGKLSNDEDAVFYILIDTHQEVTRIQKMILQSSYAQDVYMHVYPYDLLEGYHYLKINSSGASKALALQNYLTNQKYSKIISIGSRSFDVPLIEMSDYAIATASASQDMKSQADIVLAKTGPDEVVKEIQRIYYHKNPYKYLEKKRKAN